MRIVSVDLHVDYPDMHRHWDAQSERYGGGDSLLTALQSGWEMSSVIWEEEYWHAGTRPVVIYHFEMTRSGEKMNMPVVNNPFIERLLVSLRLDVRPLEKRTAADMTG